MAEVGRWPDLDLKRMTPASSPNRSYWLATFGETDRAQLRGQVLQLPGALSCSIDLALAIESDGFRGINRSVRRVIERMGYGARLAGGTRGGCRCG
jgi:hypothetical protein